MNRFIFFILLVGIALRIAVFFTSPPNNSYDDHLEAVVNTISALEVPSRVEPWACWECYQPPLYYWVSSLAAKISANFTDDAGAWKIVQSLSLLSSVLTLLLTYIALKLILPKNEHLLAIYLCLAIISILPRAIYSSAMTTNDSFLEASVITALVGFLLIIKRSSLSHFGLLMILIGTLSACWIKQSGLILTVPMIALIFTIQTNKWRPGIALEKRTIVFILFFVLIIAVSDEIWRTAKTGIFLVSNQQYYDYAISQPPGSLSNVSFFNIQGRELFNNVFMTSETLDSFWTELLARLWFDYERRFFPVNNTAIVTGQFSYIIGAIVTSFLVITSVNYIFRKPYDTTKLILLFFGLAFLTVPILQTIRYPYFSSMKAAFILPGLPAVLCLMGLGAARWLHLHYIREIVTIMIALILAFGLIHVAVLVNLSNEAWLYGLSGPLWPLHEIP